MSTITIPNLTDTPVAGETDLRQAVARAHSGDVIVPTGSSFIQLNPPLIFSAGANLTIDFGAGPSSEIEGSIVVNAGATVTIANVALTNQDLGASSPDVPPKGQDGVAGKSGEDGEGVGGQKGGGGAPAKGRSIRERTPSARSKIMARSHCVTTRSLAHRSQAMAPGAAMAATGRAAAMAAAAIRVLAVTAAMAVREAPEARAPPAATRSAPFSTPRAPSSRCRTPSLAGRRLAALAASGATAAKARRWPGRGQRR